MKKYPAYKDSDVEWIGEIPQHWKSGKVKYFDYVIMGQSPRSEDCNKEGLGFPFLQGNAEFGKLFPNAANWCEIPNKKSELNDILLSVRAPIGALNISDDVYGIGRGLSAIRAIQSHYKYLFYYLLVASDELISRGTGSTFTAVSLDEIKSLESLSIPLSEQTTIASYLDHKTAEIDTLIEKKKQLISLYKEERIATINAAVTGKLPLSEIGFVGLKDEQDFNNPINQVNPKNPSADKRKMKDSGIDWIGEIPEHWEVKRVKFIAKKVGDGLHGTPNYVEDSGYHFINGNNIRNNQINIFDSTKKVSEEESIANDKDLDSQTLLMSINGTIGNVGFYKGEKVMLGKSVAYLNFKSGINIKFISYQLESQAIQLYINKELSGSTIKNLSLESINKTPLTFPPDHEQKEIINYLDTTISRLNILISKTQKEITLLEEYKTALISEVVLGKVDVREEKLS